MFFCLKNSIFIKTKKIWLCYFNNSLHQYHKSGIFAKDLDSIYN